MAPTRPKGPRLPVRFRPDFPDTGSGRLRWQVKPPAVYYVTPFGDEWRVYDCVMDRGRLKPVDLESPAAVCRVFVADPAKGGVKKVYHRRRRELMRLTPAGCELQLRDAEFLGVTGHFDSSVRTAR